MNEAHWWYEVTTPGFHLSVGEYVSLSGNPGLSYPSLAYICPTCGTQWGRLSTGFPWAGATRLCPNHGGGSFINWDTDRPWDSFVYFDLNLPIELLRYEVTIWQPTLT